MSHLIGFALLCERPPPLTRPGMLAGPYVMQGTQGDANPSMQPTEPREPRPGYVVADLGGPRGARVVAVQMGAGGATVFRTFGRPRSIRPDHN